MQGLNEYKQALLLGQQAFEARDSTANVVPRVFGSAAYLQDPHAGLRPLEPTPQQPKQLQTTEQAPKAFSAQKTQPSAQTESIADTDNLASSEALHQPQNFKAMLEAALKGDAYPESTLNGMPLQQSQGDAQQEAMHAHVYDTAIKNTALSASDQPEGQESQVAVPHVLAWLEQGRGLFDNDEDDDITNSSEPS